MEGFKWMFNNQLVAVWSAPNYCYRCGNVASIMEVDSQLHCEFKVGQRGESEAKIFEAAPASERGIPSKKPPPDYFL